MDKQYLPTRESLIRDISEEIHRDFDSKYLWEIMELEDRLDMLKGVESV